MDGWNLSVWVLLLLSSLFGLVFDFFSESDIITQILALISSIYASFIVANNSVRIGLNW